LSREILIQTQKGERLVAIIENGQVDDFHIEVDRYQSLLGNIYKGKVESILPSINAAFVNIGQERNGFLYLTDAVSRTNDKTAHLGKAKTLDDLAQPLAFFWPFNLFGNPHLLIIRHINDKSAR